MHPKKSVKTIDPFQANLEHGGDERRDGGNTP